MDCNEVSLLRPSPRQFRPWSVISLHLWTSHQTLLTKLTYSAKSRWMDCKELSLLRLSARIFISSSSISPLTVLLDTYDFYFDHFLHRGVHISPHLPSDSPSIPPLPKTWGQWSVGSFYDWGLTLHRTECSLCGLSSLTSSILPRLLPHLQAYLN